MRTAHRAAIPPGVRHNHGCKRGDEPRRAGEQRLSNHSHHVLERLRDEHVGTLAQMGCAEPRERVLKLGIGDADRLGCCLVPFGMASEGLAVPRVDDYSTSRP